MIFHKSNVEDPETDSSNHMCLYNGAKYMEQTGSLKSTFPSTFLKATDNHRPLDT